MNESAPVAGFRVVEKEMLAGAGRGSLRYQFGALHEKKEGALAAASSLAATTLAHRMFVCVNSASFKPENVIEEIDLEPLGIRLCRRHLDALRIHNIERFEREIANPPAWVRRYIHLVDVDALVALTRRGA